MNHSERQKILALAEYYFRSNNYQFAESILKKLLITDPENSKANELLAYIYGNRSEIRLCHNHLLIACKGKDASPEAQYYLGSTFLKLKNYEKAKDYLLLSIGKAGHFFEGLHDLGTAYCHLGQKEKGLFYYKKALQLKSDSHELFFNIGKVYDDLGLCEEALNQYDKALQIEPNYINAWNNKGITLNDLKRYGQALDCFNTAIKINPNHKDSYWHKSLSTLALGNFQEGWDLYEYRWAKEDCSPYRHSQICQLESIENIKNKAILIWHEQGLGDTIQFSRYIPELIKLGANITFEVQPPLADLFYDQFNCEITSNFNNGVFFDLQLPLLSLPRIFKTSIHTIPSSKSYLSCNYDSLVEWKNRLNISKNKLNIGIAVSGNPVHTNNHLRSIDLEKISELCELGNIYLIQKELNLHDRNYLELHPEIIFVGDLIDNFLDTASVVQNMDLIISVDTSLIHLAGALGKRAFLILPWAGEWRWLVDRADSPWYNSIKIFRQVSKGDWDAVIQNIKNEILLSNE